jgi:hypothetical protein
MVMFYFWGEEYNKVKDESPDASELKNVCWFQHIPMHFFHCHASHTSE